MGTGSGMATNSTAGASCGRAARRFNHRTGPTARATPRQPTPWRLHGFAVDRQDKAPNPSPRETASGLVGN
jgi:hypothetical protein